MLTEKECIAYIEGRTGKKLGEDWGIIAGQHHPFGPTKGFISAQKFPGYQVWFRDKGVDYSLNCYPSEQQDSLDYIVNFINFVSVDPQSFETYIVNKTGAFVIDATKKTE
jgi:hypothetical protein